MFNAGDVVVLHKSVFGFSNYVGQFATVVSFDSKYIAYEIQFHLDASIILVEPDAIILASNNNVISPSIKAIMKPSICIDDKIYTLDEIKLIIKKAKAYDGDYT